MGKAPEEAKRIADEILGASNPYGDFTAKEVRPLADEYRRMRRFMEHRYTGAFRNSTEFDVYLSMREKDWELIFRD